MIPDRLETPNWSTSILKSVNADGVKELREHCPRQRRRTDLPHVGMWRVHRPGGKPAKTGGKCRSAKMRRHASAHPSQSTLDPSTDDRQINVESEFLKKAKRDDAHSSVIPDRVFSPTDSPENASQGMPIISQSAHVQLNCGRARSSAVERSEDSSVMGSPGISAYEGTFGAVERSLYHEIYHEQGPTNTLQLRLSPQHHSLTMLNELPSGNGAQASFSTLARVCDHSYEEVVVRRCKHCGSYLATDTTPSSTSINTCLKQCYQPQPPDSVENHVTESSTSTNGYQIIALLNGLSKLEYQPSRTSAAESGAIIGPMSRVSSMHGGSSANFYPSPLTIPESMQYREPTSSISTSPSLYSPASSPFQSTPVSSTSQSFLSPLLHFPDLSSDSPSGGWPAAPQFWSDGFPS